MQHPDEGTIHAWLDGALSAEEAAAIESHVAECEECSAMVAEARGLIAASSRIVSALDIIPGGVIPAAKPRRRAWYMSTQLRAAAAVIVVAGASLLVMRGGRKEAVMEESRPTAATVSAPAPVAEMKKPEADFSGTQSKPAPAVKARRVASSNAPLKSGTARRQAVPKNNSDEAIHATAPPPAVPGSTGAAVTVGPTSAARADALRSALQGKVSGVVVTGVAEEKSTELLKVSSDSTPARIRTVYEVSPGVRATLTEMLVPSFMPSTLAQAAKTRERSAFDSATARSAPQINATVAAGAAAINSITWVDKTGHMVTLTGPMSKEQLQALRLRLPADKR
jgi:Putative zinc-finger